MAHETGEAWLDTPDGTRLFYRWTAPAEPRGVVLVAHGYAEHSGRYQHVLEGLAFAGYAAIAPDHRGHGRSAKVLGLLDSIDAAVGDLSRIQGAARTRFGDLPTFMIGHSGGGLMTLLKLIRDPGGIVGATTIGAGVRVPPNIPKAMIAISKLLSKLAPKLAVQPFYEPEKLSRLKEVQDATRHDPLFYRGKIRARTGAELLKGMQAFERDAGRVRTPLLVLHGARDEVVPPSASEFLFARVGSADKTLEMIPEAFHEVLNEPEGQATLARIVSWMDEHLKSAT